jgi:tetratricopeptide (TPR) repeat protein
VHCRPERAFASAIVALLCWGATPHARAEVDRGVIRLAPQSAPAAEPSTTSSEPAPRSDARHGFDATAFDNRFESLWFQRKLFQAEGRNEDTGKQSDSIREFVVEEGVRRLEVPAGALLLESRDWLREGSYDKALDALKLAEALDPGRPQIALARAHVLWKSGAGALAAGSECVRAIRGAATVAIRDLNFVHGSALVVLAAVLGGVALFSLLMMFRYQLALRHDVEEWLIREGRQSWAKAGGWAILLLPLIVWVGAGWVAIYWIAAVFRYMKRSERALAALLLIATAVSLPAYRFAVGLFGLAADPTIRTTIAAGNGGYDPDRIVALRELVDAHPDDPMYRFLLAGLYKNGRFFEDAYQEYKRVLEEAPSTYQARINLGNIYFTLGQYGEAISNYRKALEIRPNSALAYYDMYLAQSDSFKLKEATESLASARNLDSAKTTAWLTLDSREGRGPKAIDAVIDFDSIWRATVEGRSLRAWLDAEPEQGRWKPLVGGLANTTSALALAALLACGVTLALFRGRAPAERCARCGQPFCARCKPRSDGPGYCTQCVHLFVVGEGLAPETKSMKLYQVEQYETRTRRARRVASVLLPGASHVLSGRAWFGCGLVILWLLAWIGGWPRSLAPLERLLGTSVNLAGLRPMPIPDAYGLDAVLLLAVPLGIAVWIAGNARVSRMPRV